MIFRFCYALLKENMASRPVCFAVWSKTNSIKMIKCKPNSSANSPYVFYTCFLPQQYQLYPLIPIQHHCIPFNPQEPHWMGLKGIHRDWAISIVGWTTMFWLCTKWCKHSITTPIIPIAYHCMPLQCNPYQNKMLCFCYVKCDENLAALSESSRT